MTDDHILDGIDGRVVGRSVLDEALDLHNNLVDGPSGPTWRRMVNVITALAALHPDYTAPCACHGACVPCGGGRVKSHGHSRP